jgi:hypothetical protein
MACLLLIPPTAALAQGTSGNSDVTVSVAGAFTADDMNVGGSLLAPLTGQIQGAPLVNQQAQVDGPYWSWTASVTGTVAHADGTTAPAEPADYTVTWEQPEDESPFATLVLTGNTAGTYQTSVQATVTYSIDGKTLTYQSDLVLIDATEAADDGWDD